MPVIRNSRKILILIRRLAAIGLLRDEGMTLPEVVAYVQRLRRESEEELARKT